MLSSSRAVLEDQADAYERECSLREKAQELEREIEAIKKVHDETINSCGASLAGSRADEESIASGNQYNPHQQQHHRHRELFAEFEAPGAPLDADLSHRIDVLEAEAAQMRITREVQAQLVEASFRERELQVCF